MKGSLIYLTISLQLAPSHIHLHMNKQNPMMKGVLSWNSLTIYKA